MELMNADSMNTPTKRLQHLSIQSPDFALSPIDLSHVMLDKGFSKSISSKVLNEVNCRVGELDSSPIKRVDAHQDPFGHHHQQQFAKMESIMSHYSVKRLNYTPSSSSKKKRRTLTGALDTSSPVKPDGTDGCAPRGLASRPPASSALNASPFRKISPSKKSINLNGLLNNKENEGFAVPKRLTSLEMAGVPRRISVPKKYYNTLKTIPAQAEPAHTQQTAQPSHTNLNGPIPVLKKPPVSNIPRAPSSHSLSSKPIARKSSIPQLSKQTPHHTPVQKQSSRSHIPQLVKQPSTPDLNRKSSIPRLNTADSMQSLDRKSSAPQLQRKTSIPQLDRQHGMLNFAGAHREATFDKPTVSSSQKSLNKFLKFKSKFS